MTFHDLYHMIEVIQYNRHRISPTTTRDAASRDGGRTAIRRR